MTNKTLQSIDRIIAVEGLDKTGKSTFIDAFYTSFTSLFETSEAYKLKQYAFPNKNSPIGKIIREELNATEPNKDIISSPFFLSEMNHFWQIEVFEQHKNNSNFTGKSNSIKGDNEKYTNVSYLFDRYFISTLAYQAFYNDSKIDLEFIKYALNKNEFLKIPTDIILLDAPNKIIIERTLKDKENGLNDSSDTIDEDVLNKRREAFHSALKFMSGSGIRIHSFEDTSKFDPFDMAKILLGKIYQ